MKRTLYRWAGVNVGEGVKINSSVKISGTGTLTIGADTWIGPETTIICSYEINIGSNCDIAPRVYIGDGTHKIALEGERIAGEDTSANISVGDGCWLCVNCTILPGVVLGRKCIVAAGAVVTAGSDDMKLLAGIPAKIIKDFKNVR